MWFLFKQRIYVTLFQSNIFLTKPLLYLESSEEEYHAIIFEGSNIQCNFPSRICLKNDKYLTPLLMFIMVLVMVWYLWRYLVTSENDDRKIMQHIRKKSGPERRRTSSVSSDKHLWADGARVVMFGVINFEIYLSFLIKSKFKTNLFIIFKSFNWGR